MPNSSSTSKAIPNLSLLFSGAIPVQLLVCRVLESSSKVSKRLSKIHVQAQVISLLYVADETLQMQPFS